MRHLIICMLLFLYGCSSIVSEKNIIDVDPEHDNIISSNISSVALVPEPGSVIVGHKQNVRIAVIKTNSEYDSQTNTYLSKWTVFVKNYNSTPKCVAPIWQLMDFTYIQYEPFMFLAKPGIIQPIGEMIQNTWEIDGVRVAPPPSGYLYKLYVHDPVPNAQQGEECLHILNDETIEEQ